jgi:anti-sigma factor RsiW
MMTATCEKLHAFADGELSREDVKPFRRHFVECLGCQAELGEVMALEALGQGLRQRGARPIELPVLESAPAWRSARAKVKPLPSRRSAVWIGGVIALAAGVLLVEWVRERRGGPAQSVEAPAP